MKKLAGIVLAVVGSIGIIFTLYNLAQVFVYPETYFGVILSRLVLITVLLLAVGAVMVFFGIRLTRRTRKLGLWG